MPQRGKKNSQENLLSGGVAGAAAAVAQPDGVGRRFEAAPPQGLTALPPPKRDLVRGTCVKVPTVTSQGRTIVFSCRDAAQQPEKLSGSNPAKLHGRHHVPPIKNL